MRAVRERAFYWDTKKQVRILYTKITIYVDHRAALFSNQVKVHVYSDVYVYYFESVGRPRKMSLGNPIPWFIGADYV